MKNQTIKVLVVEPGKKPYRKEVDNELHALQELVGGYIEPVRIDNQHTLLICNEEGALMNLEANRALFDKDGNAVNVVKGTFFLVTATDEGDFVSLSEERLQYYEKKYKKPDIFIVVDGLLCVVQEKASGISVKPILSSLWG